MGRLVTFTEVSLNSSCSKRRGGVVVAFLSNDTYHQLRAVDLFLWLPYVLHGHCVTCSMSQSCEGRQFHL